MGIGRPPAVVQMVWCASQVEEVDETGWLRLSWTWCRNPGDERCRKQVQTVMVLSRVAGMHAAALERSASPKCPLDRCEVRLQYCVYRST